MPVRKTVLFHKGLKKPVTFLPRNVTFVTPVRARRVLVSQPKPTEIRKKRNSSGAASPLNRLAIAARIPKLLFPFLYRICTFGFQLLFGICLITSLLTVSI